MINKKVELPVVNLRDVVFYPGMECPLYFGREFTVQAIKHAKKQTQNRVIVVTQKSVEKIQPFAKKDTYLVGTVCKILQCIELTDGSMKAIFQATEVVKILKSETRSGIRYVVGVKVEKDTLKKSPIDPEKKKEALRLLVRWNPELAVIEDPSKLEALKKETDFEKFLDLALATSSSSMAGKNLANDKKTSPKLLKIVDTHISRRQKILEQSNRTKQFAMLMAVLKDELHQELVALA